MADTNPFEPTLEDLQSLQNFPNYNMVTRATVPAMGADPLPKQGLTQGANPMQGQIPWWMAIPAFMSGRRSQPAPMPRTQMQSPALSAARGRVAGEQMARPANDNAPRTDTSRSHVGRLNSLSPDQFQAYLAARDRGMSPSDAIVDATRGK